MTTTEAQAALEAAVARRTELVKTAEAIEAADAPEPGVTTARRSRRITAAWRAVERADQAVRFATSDLEWAERVGPDLYRNAR